MVPIFALEAIPRESCTQMQAAPLFQAQVPTPFGHSGEVPIISTNHPPKANSNRKGFKNR